MTPDEHYREAERVLANVTETTEAIAGQVVPQHELEEIGRGLSRAIALAQVHATLATIYRSTERLVEKPRIECTPSTPCEECEAGHA